MVSMARPLLADADFVRKARLGRADEINTCIACNQACLDHTFGGKITSCLVNPRACHETELVLEPTDAPKRIAVVGAGPAGLSFALNAAARGNAVTLFDAAAEIGGQLNIAKKIPGKEEFHETLRYFRRQLELSTVTLRLGATVSADELVSGGFDEIVLATGIKPRVPDIEGIGHAKVMTYLDVLRDGKPVGRSVAVIGAGGIGFDVSEYITHEGESGAVATGEILQGMGCRSDLCQRGRPLSRGSRGVGPALPAAAKVRQDRQPAWQDNRLDPPRIAEGAQCRDDPGVTYDRIDDLGLHVTISGKAETLPVDTVVVCAGQEPRRDLVEALRAAGREPHLIGGCRCRGRTRRQAGHRSGNAARARI